MIDDSSRLRSDGHEEVLLASPRLTDGERAFAAGPQAPDGRTSTAVRRIDVRLLRLVRQVVSSSWTDDRVLQTLPPDSTAALITDAAAASTGDLRRLAALAPAGRVELLPFAPEGGPGAWADLHGRLARIPELDVLAVAVDDEALGEALLRQCLYYLRDNGIWVSVGDRHRTRRVRRLARRLRGIRRARGFRPDAEASLLKAGPIAMKQPDGAVATERLAAAVTSVRNARTHLLLRTSGSRLLKVRETAMTQRLIDARGITWAHERVEQRAVEFDGGAVLHLNRERFRYRFADRFSAPDLKIREYEDVVCQRRQIVHRDGLVLPDTFRLTGQEYLRTSVLQDVDARFARPAKQPAPGVLRGSYYYLDTEFPNVYGHLVTEMVGRLWAWHGLKAADPGLKLLLSDRAATKDLPDWCRTTLNAFGVADDDIVLLHAPMRVERLLAVTPQFVNYERGYAHPAIAQVWDRLASGLRAGATLTDPPRRIFVSRPPDNNRLCRNRDEVERWFDDRGFAVVRPERLSVPDQAVLFGRAEAVAGYGGSGMLNAVYATAPARRLVINPWSYHALNEYLISTVHRDEITYLYQRPDVEAPTPEFPKGPFHSPYTVDLDADRELLSAFAAG